MLLIEKNKLSLLVEIQNNRVIIKTSIYNKYSVTHLFPYIVKTLAFTSNYFLKKEKGKNQYGALEDYLIKQGWKVYPYQSQLTVK